MEENKLYVTFPDNKAYQNVANIIAKEITKQNSVLNDTSDHTERIPIMTELVILAGLEVILSEAIKTNQLIVSKNELGDILNTYTNLLGDDMSGEDLEDYLFLKYIFDNWPEYYSGPYVESVFPELW